MVVSISECSRCVEPKHTSCSTSAPHGQAHGRLPRSWSPTLLRWGRLALPDQAVSVSLAVSPVWWAGQGCRGGVRPARARARLQKKAGHYRGRARSLGKAGFSRRRRRRRGRCSLPDHCPLLPSYLHPRRQKDSGPWGQSFPSGQLPEPWSGLRRRAREVEEVTVEK